MHAARRVGARLNPTTKFGTPDWLPSDEEREQLEELRRILVAKPQQSSLRFFGYAGGPRPHTLDEREGAPMKALVKEKPEPGLWLSECAGSRVRSRRCSSQDP